jgi:hypothetical protein
VKEGIVEMRDYFVSASDYREVRTSCQDFTSSSR